MALKTNSFPTPAPRVRNRWFNTSTVGGVVFSENLCKQEFKDECDINKVLARYREGPPRPWASPPTLRFGDFAEAPDFLGAQLLVKQAEEQFNSLDVRVRDRFQHNPVRFLEFIHDPKNFAEAKALGLLRAEAEPPSAPPPVPPVEGPK